MKEIIIDGNKINNLEDFYKEIEQFLEQGNCPWGRNLDSLDEIVSSAFNYTNDKTLDVEKITWLNSERSRNILGVEETIKWWKEKENSDVSSEEIQKLQNGQGETLFEKITSILQGHKNMVTLFVTTKEDGGKFNKLEKAILEWFAQKYKDSPAFVSQLKSAVFKKREANSAGFFIDLDVPRDLSPIDFQTFSIGGPYIDSKDIEYEAIAVLLEKEGYLTCIDIAGSGSFYKENIEDFKLCDQENEAESKEYRDALDRKPLKEKIKKPSIFKKIAKYTLLTIFLLSILPIFVSSPRVKRNAENINKIQPGMTAEEVVAIMGQPINIEDVPLYPQYEYTYRSPGGILSAGDYIVFFYKDSNTVRDVYRGD
jgi:RNAse (barnase) inhibitor barstar